jgi:hypothetical protein
MPDPRKLSEAELQKLADEYVPSKEDQAEPAALRIIIALSNKITDEKDKIETSCYQDLALKIAPKIKALKEQLEKERRQRYLPKKSFVGEQQSPAFKAWLARKDIHQ